MSQVDVLIPTYNRPQELAVTVATLCYQKFQKYRLTVSDQSESFDPLQTASVLTAFNLHKMQGRTVIPRRHLPRRGMAEHRQYLLDNAEAPYVLFLDDDLILEPYVIENMLAAIQKYRCGFVGQAPIGLSYVGDHRPHEQAIEFWGDIIDPEVIEPGDGNWNRYQLHNAANIYHVQQQLKVTSDRPRPYKIAWIGSCVLFDRKKLVDCEGFNFWKELPPEHVGEDVQAQLQVLRRYGGCGLIPSGVYHLESATTLRDRRCNAPEYLRRAGYDRRRLTTE